ncbi:MAG: lysophospholipase [Stenomitos rutilans HA7619-LM2]|nr:lysophospholipase [Stenomitos rutilans HA7619-LM2]
MFRRFISLPGWAILSFSISGLLLGSALLLRSGSLTSFLQVNASTVPALPAKVPPAAELGQRRQLTYEQWVALLGREANVVAESHPKGLTVLAGDSLSLWFPPDLLPQGSVWLNQGISGETSFGLLRRLKLFDRTQPETVFVMIGINDLIRGLSAETLLANYREIMLHLRKAHPQAQIVVQSILPHAGSRLPRSPILSSPLPNQQLALWESRLAIMPNRRIQQLNQTLAAMAKAEGLDYLDLYPFFTDANGDLAADLSTDGLHLSVKGYQVWRSRLQLFAQQQATAVRQLPQTPATQAGMKR